MHSRSNRRAKWPKPQGVKTLVLSPFCFQENGAVPDQVFVDEARKAFSGEIIAGRDLLEI